jgi:hypothetical protein
VCVCVMCVCVTTHAVHTLDVTEGARSHSVQVFIKATPGVQERGGGDGSRTCEQRLKIVVAVVDLLEARHVTRLQVI